MNSHFDTTYKFLILGDSSVGKTSFIQKYTNNTFNLYQKSTIGIDYSIQTAHIDNKTIRLQIWDTAGWTYKATSYDPLGNVLDDLPVEATTGSVTISVDSCITENWGTGYKNIVAELPFDLQVTIPGISVSGSETEDTIWTPVIGTICVLGNVTPGGSL